MNASSFSPIVPTFRAEDSSSFVSGSHIHIRKAFFGADLLRVPVSGFKTVRLRHLEHTARNGRQFSTFARIKKGQKHEYPWPDNIDPNLESGHLAYLSDFKPLAEKAKLVTLDFEKPLVQLDKKIIDVRKMADETGLDFNSQITELESKYQQALKDLYTHLTPFQRVAIARHPNRPTFLDHVMNITDKWVELHGDRAGYDDPAIVTGLGSIDGKTYMLIGHQKGRNTKENIRRNFGMPTPHGYRKALRMMRYADHHGFPIITFIDTPGAFADLKSEELGQGEAIAFNLRAMFGFKVPIVSIVIGEGGSGGALAIGCANKLYMMENAVFYVASPEACAAILWKNSQEAPMAAEKLKITGPELCKLKVADEIIPEPLGGAHTDPTWTSLQIKIKVMETMKELGEMDTDKLLHHRYMKFRIIGAFLEGEPVDEEKKWAMKKKEADYSLPIGDIQADIETIRKAIVEANGNAAPTLSFEMKENLQQQVNKEMTDAIIAMGLQEKFEDIKMEISKSPGGALSAPLQERADRLMQEFKYHLSRPGSYMKLKQTLETLGEVSKLLDEQTWKKLNEKLQQEQVEEKMEILRSAREKVVNGQVLDQDQLEKVNEAKEELLESLESSNVEILGLNRRIKHALPGHEELRKADQMIMMEIEKAIDEAGLRSKIDLLRQELKAETEDGSNNDKIEKLESEIKGQIADAINMDNLKKKVNDALEWPAFGKADGLIKEGLEMAIDEAGIRSKINELRERLEIELETDLSYEKIEKLQSEIREQIVAAIDMDKLKKKIEAAIELHALKAQETVGVGQLQG